MDPTALTDRMASLPLLSTIPREQLAWVAERALYHDFGDGTVIYGTDIHFGRLFIVLSGRFSVRVDRDGVEREIREVMPGGISGFPPYTRMVRPAGYVVTDGRTEVLSLEADEVREMTSACYDLTAMCVHEMLDRVRTFKSLDVHREKMLALGRLSAGLAHELNNPSSAIGRAVRTLGECREQIVRAAGARARLALDGGAAAAVEPLEAAAGAETVRFASDLERADREDAICSWLEDRALDTRWAHALCRSSVSLEELEAAAAVLARDDLRVVLDHVVAGLEARALEHDIATAADRIHSLVAAIKKHTHMDRAPVREPIDVGEHLAGAVALLDPRARAKGVSMELRTPAELPAVMGFVTDLNHVWQNLLDNAIEAAAPSGHVTVSAANENGQVVVRVVDDGPGIPAEHVTRVFEPFFTTKDVGAGVGLGLDMVQAIVRGHGGVVEVESGPGNTEFRVTLPVG